MADIPQFTPLRGDMVQPVWFEKWERWSQGIYVYSGGAAAPASGMDISIDELTTNYGTTAADASFSIAAAHATLARMDVLYQTAAGAFAVHKGDDAAIVDPLGNYNSGTHANWTQLEAPYPKAGLPAGCPMYLIFVAPAVTEIIAADIVPIAAKGIITGTTWVWETMTDADATHTLAHSPVANSLSAYRNGVLITEGAGLGYTRSGADVTLTTARGGHTILFHYQY